MHKIAVIGVGAVGSATAFSIMEAGICKELVLVDVNTALAEGEAMDMAHGVPFSAPCNVHAGTFADCDGASVVIITAGATQKPGETRLDLLDKNAAIMRSILSSLKPYNVGILLIVANPVDVLTAIAQKESGLPRHRVIGSGTVLDTSRLKSILGKYAGVDPRSVHGYVLGEHGDSELVAWSLTRIAGMPLESYCQLCTPQADSRDEDTQGQVIVGDCDQFPIGKCGACADDLQSTFRQIDEDVRHAGYEILRRKGATNYAIALAVRRIVQAILSDEHTVLTVTVPAPVDYPESCFALPAVIGRNGVERVLPVALTTEEEAKLRHSAQTLHDSIARVMPKG